MANKTIVVAIRKKFLLYKFENKKKLEKNIFT